MAIRLIAIAAMGHWAPGSTMPLTYDRSRCTGELIVKHRIAERLKAGFEPGGPYELPREETREDTEEEEQREEENPRIFQCLLNSNTGTLHQLAGGEDFKTVCPYVPDPTRPNYTVTCLTQDQAKRNTRCPRCWGQTPIELPEWENVPDEGEEDTEQPSISSSASSSSRNDPE